MSAALEKEREKIGSWWLGLTEGQFGATVYTQASPSHLW